jgi:protein-disulfide isomerase
MLQPAVNNKDHVLGKLPAAIVLTEYGDYQCPHCGHAYPIVQKLIRHFGDNLTFVFRNFPLSEAHPMALPAALSTEVAETKGKYWQLHDAIFEHQDLLEEGIQGLLKIIQSAGLDPEDIQSQWTSKALLQKVSDDFESGLMSGVNGTPTFFINGVKYDGSPEFGDLKKALAAHM